MQDALERAVTREEFSREFFPGNGWRNHFNVGYITPRTPARRAALLEQACELASIVEQNSQLPSAPATRSRKSELARRRDEAILTALRAPYGLRNNSALSLNGRTYALIKMEGKSYTYVDITDKEKYEVTRAFNEDGSYIPHVIYKDGNKRQNLGQVVRNQTDLGDWTPRAPDGSSLDPDFPMKIKKQQQWSENLDDESARREVGRETPGFFRVYSSNHEGCYKVAYKGADHKVYVREFDSSTGQFLTEKTNFLSFEYNLSCAIAKSRDKLLAASDFLINIRKQGNWRGNYTDKAALEELSREWPGAFRLYPSDTEGKYKIAYKGMNRCVHIDEFDGSHGQIIDKDNGFDEGHVFLIVAQLEALRVKTAQPSVEQLRHELKAEKERLSANDRFSREHIETYIYWKSLIRSALIVSWTRGDQDSFYAAQNMLLAVDSVLPSDIYAVLKSAARVRAANTALVAALRSRAAEIIAKNPANAAKPTSPAEDRPGMNKPFIPWDQALSGRPGGAAVDGRAERQARYARIARQEQERERN
jgi:hypothetical protein